ncbi:MAG: polysaccharide biosynthesis tyrosine autokinase [Planctomycetota bacterium]
MPSPTQFSISLPQVLAALRRWWRVALPLAVVLSLGGAAAVYALWVPMYRAKVFLILQRSPTYIVAPLPGNVNTFVNNQVEMVKSNWVLDEVLKHESVAKIPEINSSIDPVDRLRADVSVKIMGNSDFFTIEARSINAQNAANIANAVAEEYLKYQDKMSSNENDVLVKTLNERKQFHSQQIEKLREKVSELARRAAVADPFDDDKDKDKLSPAALSISLLREKLVEVLFTQEMFRAELRALDDRQRGNGADIPPELIQRRLDEHPAMLDVVQKLLQQRERLLSVEKLVAPGKRSAETERIQEEITKLEEQRAVKSADLREAVKTALLEERKAGAVAERKSLQIRIDQQESLRQALEEKVASETEAKKDATSDLLKLEFARIELRQASAIYDKLSNRVEHLDTERMAPERVRLQAKAKTPLTPEEKHPFKSMALVGGGLFTLPFVLLIGWELLMRRIGGREELERTSGLRVIGEIPDFTRIGKATGTNRQLAPYEESINSLRTHIVLSQNARDLQVLSVASAVSGEGKTSVAAKLAVSISRATKMPTLLIDGDIRRPDIHRLFDIQYTPGLGDVLAERCKLDDAIVHDEQTGLDILPAGNMHSNPHQSMSGPIMNAIMAEARRRYRHIVVDTTPVLQASESLNVHAAVDGCLICTMRDVTRVDRFQLAFRRLMAAGARPLGVVLNGVSWMQYSNRYGGYEYYAEAVADTK